MKEKNTVYIDRYIYIDIARLRIYVYIVNDI